MAEERQDRRRGRVRLEVQVIMLVPGRLRCRSSSGRMSRRIKGCLLNRC